MFLFIDTLIYCFVFCFHYPAAAEGQLKDYLICLNFNLHRHHLVTINTDRQIQPATYRLALLVLASVQHSPVDLSGVSLGQEGRLALGVQKLEHLMKTDNHILK